MYLTYKRTRTVISELFLHAAHTDADARTARMRSVEMRMSYSSHFFLGIACYTAPFATTRSSSSASGENTTGVGMVEK